ncbi:MAG: amino acid adenylation domain-containing protein [Methylococcaceae bacterium]|nr:amino acid adenylation domain-containing protein [Methylococcaceae bacterium]
MNDVIKANLQDIYPLSPMQQGMLFHTLAAPESDAYFEQMRYVIRGRLDISLFEQSWQRLIARHDVLRTVFVYKQKARLLQMVLKQRRFNLVFEDIRTRNASEQADYLEQLAQQDRAQGFDLSRDLLLRITLVQTEANVYHMLWSVPHIILDAWCFGIIYQELFSHYQVLSKQQAAPLSQPVQYSTYIKWLLAKDMRPSQVFWTGYLQNCQQASALYARTQKKGAYQYAHQSFALQCEQTAALEQFARQHALTLNTLVQGAWGLLLRQHNLSNQVVFGVTVSGRPAEIPGVESILGLFINTIPVCFTIDPTQTLVQFMAQVQADSLSAQAHHYSSLAEIQAHSPLKQHLINHVLVFENTPTASEQAALDFSIEQTEMYEHPDYDLMVSVTPAAALQFSFTYNALQFSSSEIARAAAQLEQILMPLMNAPQQTIQVLNVLPEAQQGFILEHLSQSAPTAENKTFLTLLQMQVERCPQKTALISGANQLSYQQLNQRSSALAGYLSQQYALQPEDKVAVLLPRNENLVISLLAILKTGAAYVPLDLSYPAERLRYIVQHSGATLILTQDNATDFGVANVDLSIWVDHGAAADHAPLLEPAPHALAYMLYTSGSTGQPKGVMIEQQQLAAFLTNLSEHFRFVADDTLLAITPISFDISILELLGSLSLGMTCVLADEHTLQNPQALLALIPQQRISVLQTTPARLKWLLNASNISALSALRIILVGGEALPSDLAQQLTQLHATQVFNVYGPTEATIWSSYKMLKVDEPLTIGRALNQETLYIVDADLKLQAIGAPGEIAIAGAGVGRGYWQDDKRTTQAFLQNPYHPGQALYKTGDLGVWLENGEIEYLGRLDDQVKIRGYRIELGEIEAQLLALPEITQAVVVNAGAADHAQLIAFVVLSKLLSDTHIKQHLSDWLPHYMLPSQIHVLAELPLNQSGKVDKKALTARAQDLGRAHTPHRAARTPLEQRALALWQELLEQPVGIDDDFFAVGGNSLSAISLVVGLTDIYQQPISLSQFLNHPSIAQLSAALTTENSAMTLLNGRVNSAKKVFCFPPITGFGAVFKSLADYFDESFYACDYDAHRDMVQASIAAIKQQQAQGPYILLGYSAGGNLAYQVARALLKQNDTIAALILLDSVRIAHIIEFSATEKNDFIQVALGEMDLAGNLEHMQQTMRHYLDYIMQHPQTEALACAIHYLQAEPGRARLTADGFARDWHRVAVKKYAAYSAVGDHFQLLRQPYVQTNAQFIKQILDLL